MTIGMIVRLWKEDKRKYVKYSTFSAYVLILEKHILPVFGGRKEIGEQEVQEFVLEKLRQGLSQKSVKDILVVLRMVVKFGAEINACNYKKWNIRFPQKFWNSHSIALAILSRQRLFCSSPGCTYRFSVVRMSECPSSALTVL